MASNGCAPGTRIPWLAGASSPSSSTAGWSALYASSLPLAASCASWMEYQWSPGPSSALFLTVARSAPKTEARFRCSTSSTSESCYTTRPPRSLWNLHIFPTHRSLGCRIESHSDALTCGLSKKPVLRSPASACIRTSWSTLGSPGCTTPNQIYPSIPIFHSMN